MHWVGVVAPWVVLYFLACLMVARTISWSYADGPIDRLITVLAAGLAYLAVLWAFLAVIKQVVM